MAKDETDSTRARPDEHAIAAMLEAVAVAVQAMPKEELLAQLQRLRREHAAEFEERLRPFRTPVTEETMRRSVG